MLLSRYPKLKLSPKHPVERKAVPIFNGLRALWVQLN